MNQKKNISKTQAFPAGRSRMRDGGWRVIIWIFGCALVWGKPWEARAQPESAQPFCSIKQITDPSVGGTFFPSMSADGTRIAFAAAGESAEGAADGNGGFFLFDTTTNTLTQITNTAGVRLSAPSLSANGTRVAFASTVDPIGTNTDGNFEVFLFDASTGTLSQITNVVDHASSSLSPSINADGTRIAFTSTADLTGNNTDSSEEIFLFDTTTNTFTQITNTSTTNGVDGRTSYLTALINAAGTRIIFGANTDLTGENADGNFEIFVFDTTTNTFSQVTHTFEVSQLPSSISADGTRIVFDTVADLTGENPDGNFEIFLFDVTTNSFIQITQTTEGRNSSPALNIDGTRVAFEFEEPSFESEIFLFDTITNSLIQITHTEGTSHSPSLNADGTRTAFVSASDGAILVGADLLGYSGTHDADGNAEIFLSRCTPPAAQSETIKAVVESPPAGPVSGTAVIHGWAFPTQAYGQLNRVELLIDGRYFSNIPCCSERADVQTVFPEFPSHTTLNSGWGMAFNWGILSQGTHTVRINIKGKDGELVFSELRAVSVIKLGDFEFLDQFDLSGATTRIEGEDIIIEGIEVKDKNTQQPKVIDTRVRWFVNSQGLEIVSSTE